MSRETLGYVKLEWTCPKCGSRNPGPEKTCLSCGAPQPQDVQFEQTDTQEILKDEDEIKRAKAGADIHCAFCGARNPAGSVTCTQCGADLVEGVRRDSGKVVGAFKTGPAKMVPCPSCNAENPETALKCANCGSPLTLEKEPQTAAPSATPVRRPSWMIFAVVAALVLFCIIAVASFAFLSSSRESHNAVVERVEWQTSLEIEELGPATYETWQDDIPQGAQVGQCVEKVHHVQEDAPQGQKSNKVCGTPYTVDQGSGYAQVVQDCVFEVLLPYCEYVVQEWRAVEQAKLSGSDFLPVLPDPPLNSNRRLGDEHATFIIVFDSQDGHYDYSVSSLDQFRQFEIGSEWILNINAFDQIVSVEPAD